MKFCSYFPYNAKLCLNGNEWAKRQAAKAGIGFTALDNGFAAVDDPSSGDPLCPLNAFSSPWEPIGWSFQYIS